MGAGPARERQAELAGRIPETWFFRYSVLRIRDAVQWWCLPGPLKPSMAAVSLAIPGQTAPSRHHHCPAHWTAEPPRVTKPPGPFYKPDFVAALGGEFSKERRDRVGPSRTVFGQGWPNAEPCMFNADEQLRLFTSYRGGRLSLEAVLTDLVCRVAPRLITNLEEYQEAGLAGLRIARSRQYQVRGRGTGGYCGIDVDARGRV